MFKYVVDVRQCLVMQFHEERAFKYEAVSVLRAGVDDFFEREDVLLAMPVTNDVDSVAFAFSKNSFDYILMTIWIPYCDANWKP